jgi:hypothetical protein
MTRFVPVGLILLVTIIQVVSGPSWIYSSGFVDHWIYHGYFLNLRYLLATFPKNYYGSRLAWVLPGLLAHSIFGPLLANAVLRLYLLFIATLSCFFLIRRSYGVRCALISTLLFCSYPDLLAAVGWDYVDGAVVAYSLLGLEELGAAACLFQQERRMAFLRCGLAGVAFAAASHSNLTVILLFPMITLWFLARAGVKGLILAPAAASGFGLLTFVLGLVNVLFGGPFPYFLGSLWVLRGYSVSVKMFRVPLQKWIGSAWWLVIPVAACLVSAAFVFDMILKRQRDSETSKRIADCGLLLAVFAVFLALYLRGNLMLQVPYYSSYLAIFLPGATGALIGMRLEQWKRPAFLSLAGCCALLALLIGAQVPSWLGPLNKMISEFRPSITAMPLAVLLGVALIVALRARPRWISAGVGITCLGATLLYLGSKRLDGSTAARVGSSYLWVFSHYSTTPIDAQSSREIYEDATGTIRQLMARTHGRRLWMWYSYPADHKAHYTNIASAFIWGDSFLNMSLPDTTELPLGEMRVGHYVAIMDSRPELLGQAVHQLKRAGVTVEREDLLTSSVQGRQYRILLVKVTRVERLPEVPWPSGIEEPLTPAKVLLEFDAVNLAGAATPVLYGETWPKYQGLPGWVTRMTDPKDCRPVQFVQLMDGGQRAITNARLEVDLADERPEGEYGTVKMIVQDQNFRSLYQSELLPEGERNAILTLPAGTTALRLVFLPNEKGFIRLPERVRVRSLPPAPR